MPRKEDFGISNSELKKHNRESSSRGGHEAMVNAARREVVTENLEEDYKTYFSLFEVLNQAPQHFFPLKNDEDIVGALTALDCIASYNAVIFADSVGSAHSFSEHYEDLAVSGISWKESPDNEFLIEFMMYHASNMLDDVYGQVESMKKLIYAKPRHMARTLLTGRNNIKAIEIERNVGVEKPPEFTAGLRKFIPRWMTHGIEHPGAGIDMQDDEATAHPWGTFTERNAHFLISPDQIAEGKAPLHMVLQRADELKAQGDSDTSYELQTWGILNVLHMEQQYMQGDIPEMPLFTYILGGLIASNQQPDPKKSHYNYSRAIDDTMRETFSRIREEKRQGATGTATAFLNELSQYYPEHFPDLVALALTKYDENGQGIDMFPIMKALSDAEQPWARGVYDSIEQISIRRVIATSEIETIAALLPQRESIEIDMSTQVIEDAMTIVGDRDMIDFRTQMNKMYPELKGPRLDMELELDIASEAMTGRLSVEDEEEILSVPFMLSFAGDSESFQFSAIDETPLSQDALLRYRGVVVDALHQQAEKIRRNQPKLKPKKGQRAVYEPAKEAPTVLAISQLDRKRRMEMYERQHAREKRKNLEQTPVVELVQDQPVTIKEHKQPAPSIYGLDYTNIRTLLDEQAIKAVTPNRLIARVSAIIENAVDGDKELGKQVNLETFGPEASDINLRQISWTISGIHATILVYVQEKGAGNYVFRGATERKGKQQANYITEIVNGILTEEI